MDRANKGSRSRTPQYTEGKAGCRTGEEARIQIIFVKYYVKEVELYSGGNGVI